MTRMYSGFSDLPKDIQEGVRVFHPKDFETWISEPVPALGKRSVLDVINSGEEGVYELRRYIAIVKERSFSS